MCVPASLFKYSSPGFLSHIILNTREHDRVCPRRCDSCLMFSCLQERLAVRTHVLSAGCAVVKIMWVHRFWRPKRVESFIHVLFDFPIHNGLNVNFSDTYPMNTGYWEFTCYTSMLSSWWPCTVLYKPAIPINIFFNNFARFLSKQKHPQLMLGWEPKCHHPNDIETPRYMNTTIHLKNCELNQFMFAPDSRTTHCARIGKQ